MAKKNEPFKVDKYNSRLKRVKNLNKPDTIYSKDKVCNFMILIFVLTDFTCIFTKWNVMRTQNIECLIGIGVSSAIALDVPLAVAAVAVKEYLQGLRTRLEKDVVLWISIIAFAIAFGGNFMLGFVTRNLFFSENTSEGLLDAASQAAGTVLGPKAILYAAAVSGLIPLLTSICSFAFSFYCYDPLKKRIEKIETERIGLQSNLMEIEKAIAEAETKEEFFQEMTEREEKLFSDFMEKLEAERMGMEQVAGVVIMEKMENAQKVTKIFRDNEKRMEKQQEKLIFRGNPDELPEEAKAETVEELPEDITEEILDELPEDIAEELSEDITEEIPEELQEEMIPGEESEDAGEQELFLSENEENYRS